MCISPSILFFPRKLIIRTVFCFSFHSQTSQPRRSAIKSALRKPLGDKMGAFRASAEIERLAASAKKENANITLCSPLSVSSFLTVYSRLFCFLSFSSFFFFFFSSQVFLSFFQSAALFAQSPQKQLRSKKFLPSAVFVSLRFLSFVHGFMISFARDRAADRSTILLVACAGSRRRLGSDVPREKSASRLAQGRSSTRQSGAREHDTGCKETNPRAPSHSSSRKRSCIGRFAMIHR